MIENGCSCVFECREAASAREPLHLYVGDLSAAQQTYSYQRGNSSCYNQAVLRPSATQLTTEHSKRMPTSA